MKRILLSIVLLAIVFTGCKKETPEDQNLQDVSFKAIKVEPTTSLKSTTINCSDVVPTNAHILIGGNVTFDPAVYAVGGELYTQAIKLAPGAYTVYEFFLYKDNPPVGYGAEDQIIFATPVANSPYAQYTNPDLTFNFNVGEYTKTEVPVQVLCFDAAVYQEFGFDWFNVDQVVLREVCFYGDLCITDPLLFTNSIYSRQGVNVDEVAVIKVIVKRNNVDVPGSPFSNYATYDNPAPLCVQYPDYSGVQDVFTFELQVWVPSTTPGLFTWQTYATLTTTDAAPLAGVGAQGVFDFAIGSCSPNSTNIYTPLTPQAPPCNPAFYQDFSLNSFGWLDYPGPITVANGYAIMQEGAFTRFDQFYYTWTGEWTAETDVYLDPAWAGGDGFDYTVASSNSTNGHRRDFIFHVSKDISTNSLLVGASNNSSNSSTRQDLELIPHFTVTSAGWYTLKHTFRNNGGVLAVDLQLLSGNTVLWTATLSDGTDQIPSVVGGNRYGWFTFIDVPGGIKVDNTKLTRTCN